MPRYKAILLDVDGTLVDSNDAHAQAWVQAFQAHGREVAFSEVRERIGKGGDKVMLELAGLEDDSPEAKALEKTRSETFAETFLPKLKGFEKARELLQRLRSAGYKIVVASSAKEKELEPLLAAAGVSDLIEHQTSSDDAENSKPDPDIVVAAVKQSGFGADEVVMLGDTPYDDQAASKAGVAFIGVRSGGWDDADMPGAIAVYDDVADLLRSFESSPLRKASETRVS